MVTGQPLTVLMYHIIISHLVLVTPSCRSYLCPGGVAVVHQGTDGSPAPVSVSSFKQTSAV